MKAKGRITVEVAPFQASEVRPGWLETVRGRKTLDAEGDAVVGGDVVVCEQAKRPRVSQFLHRLLRKYGVAIKQDHAALERFVALQLEITCWIKKFNKDYLFDGYQPRE